MSKKIGTPVPPPGGQFLVYETPDGKLKLDVRFEGETVWLAQQHMATLFQTTKQNISLHIQNVFSEDELRENSVVKQSLITAADGKSYATKLYNLDVIISVGYRVKSHRGTQFRIWATQRLREFIVKGFVLDDERLKNPDQPFDYFEELSRRIQDIRTSERRFYQKITDIYATSIDYDPTLAISIQFFQAVQNKVHWASVLRAGAARPSASRTSRSQRLSERARAGCAEQPRGAVPDLRPRPGDAARTDAHGGLDQQAGRVPQAQRP